MLLPTRAKSVVRLLAVLLVLKVTVAVLLNWADYFPPNFQSDFLLGRDSYFFGWYQWAFYLHIVAGPVSLVLGLLLMSAPLRTRFPALHRRMGRVQVICVATLVVPSGLAMAYHAQNGAIAGVGFAATGVLTLVCVMMGWRAAMRRRFPQHELWMQRCFALLCSAVVVRVIGGATETFGWGDAYSLAAWLGWIVPLAGIESIRLLNRRSTRRRFLRHQQS